MQKKLLLLIKHQCGYRIHCTKMCAQSTYFPYARRKKLFGHEMILPWLRVFIIRNRRRNQKNKVERARKCKRLVFSCLELERRVQLSVPVYKKRVQQPACRGHASSLVYKKSAAKSTCFDRRETQEAVFNRCKTTLADCSDERALRLNWRHSISTLQ